MFNSIDLFEPKQFISSDLRPSTVTFRQKKARSVKRKAVAVCQTSIEKVFIEFVEESVVKKLIRPKSYVDRSHRL